MEAKVGRHQHLYVVTGEDPTVMSTVDIRAPTVSATLDVDDKHHIGDTSLGHENATEAKTLLHPPSNVAFTVHK